MILYLYGLLSHCISNLPFLRAATGERERTRGGAGDCKREEKRRVTGKREEGVAGQQGNRRRIVYETLLLVPSSKYCREGPSMEPLEQVSR